MIIKIILVVLGFGVTVFVHEFGHFIMARRAGVKVETFSIGFGPVIWRMLTDRKGTRYVLSLIPLGGYVKMLGQEDLPSKDKTALTPDHYLAKSPVQRMGIICAGVIMNLLLAYLLMIVALWIGIDFIPAEIGRVQVGTPAAAEGGFAPGDIIRTMNGKPIYTFVDVKTNVALAGEDAEFSFLVDRDGVERTVVLKPQQSSPFNTPKGLPPMAMLGIAPALSPQVHGISTDSDAYRQGIRTGMEIKSVTIEGGPEPFTRPERIEYMTEMNPGRKAEVTFVDAEGREQTISTEIQAVPRLYRGFMTMPVVGVVPGGPAQQAGMQTGDIILALNSIPVRGWKDILEITRRLGGNRETVLVKIERDGIEQLLPVPPYYDASEGRVWLGFYLPDAELPDLTRTVSFVEPDLAGTPGMVAPGDVIDADGVNLKDEMVHVTFTRAHAAMENTYAPLTRNEGFLFDFDYKRTKLRKGFFSAFGYAFVRYVDELKRIYIFLGKVVTGKLSAKMIGGPVQIANITYTVASYGMGYFLYLFSLIGLSLGVMNILPIPVLDGGILAFLVYEMIRGKPASEKIQVGAQYVGLGLLLLLIVFVTYNDILRLLH